MIFIWLRSFLFAKRRSNLGFLREQGRKVGAQLVQKPRRIQFWKRTETFGHTILKKDRHGLISFCFVIELLFALDDLLPASRAELCFAGDRLTVIWYVGTSVYIHNVLLFIVFIYACLRCRCKKWVVCVDFSELSVFAHQRNSSGFVEGFNGLLDAAWASASIYPQLYESNINLR